MMWLTVLVFASVPLVWAIFSIRYILLVWHLRKVGIAVPGQIIQQREWHNRGNIFFIPTVQFTTQVGEMIEVENKRLRSPKSFLAKQPVLVYYDPQQPTVLLFAEQLVSKTMYWWLMLGVVLLFFIWRAIGRDLFHLTF
jgi:hypothetical protein